MTWISTILPNLSSPPSAALHFHGFGFRAFSVARLPVHHQIITALQTLLTRVCIQLRGKLFVEHSSSELDCPVDWLLQCLDT